VGVGLVCSDVDSLLGLGRKRSGVQNTVLALCNKCFGTGLLYLDALLRLGR